MLFLRDVGWRIASFFFEKPEREAYVNQIARETGLGKGTVSTICRTQEGEEVLVRKILGNSVFYSLNNSSPLVKALKLEWILRRLLKHREDWETDEFQSVALFGSYANGEFVSKSDVDLLVITNVGEKTVFEHFKKTRESLGTTLSLTVLPIAKWRKMALAHDRFYTEVLSSHVLLRGSPLVVV
ncbi:nucleotidyltransferase domain-containing protein [Candidatus Micrarchaeota archaeon]|nr:nucleotidyltransferase domain-containing protein [Candidatus Micrarchaeota archaeon]